MATRSEFRQGEVLFDQGGAGDRVLRVIAGEVEILREVGGASVVLGIVRSGEWLGEMAVIENRRHSATARAATDGAVEILTARQFLDQISSDPTSARGVILRLSIRLRQIEDKVAGDLFTFTGESPIGRNYRTGSDVAVTGETAISIVARSDGLRARIGRFADFHHRTSVRGGAAPHEGRGCTVAAL